MERSYTQANRNSDIQTAFSLLSGKKEDLFQAFQILVDAAYAGDKDAFNTLGNCFFCGDFGFKDITLAKYISDIIAGKNPSAIMQYSEEPKETESDKEIADAIKASEQKHLDSTIRSIETAIDKLQYKIDNNISAYCLEMDIQADLLRKRQEISNLIEIVKQPYYGRIDVDDGTNESNYYIGERQFDGIVSVWSEFGRHFRAKREGRFIVNGVSYTVKLRRQIDIKSGHVISVFDMPISKSLDDTQEIYDPFLRKVLEEKRGEANVSNIIRSIQQSQNEIIDFDFDKNLIVQGCAGSGKTMILLHRLANMKYNRPNMEWKNVKIITPNEMFNTYIDDISADLGINMIRRCSLPEYYLLLIERYSNTSNGRFNARTEAKNIVSDVNLDYEAKEYIYSKDFAVTLKESIRQYAEKIWRKNVAFHDKLKKIETIIGDILQKQEFHIDIESDIDTEGNIDTESDIDTKRDYHYQCILYAKVLGLYFLYGERAPLTKDTLLCIDEGQDISHLQYRLLQQVNGGTVCFNIYGDIHQTVPQICGNPNWESLQKFIAELPGQSSSNNVPLFSLQENYRNSQEIVEFYNDALKKKDRALGIKVKKYPRYVERTIISTLCKFHLLLQNRVAIIGNDFSAIPPEVKSLCIEENQGNGKASLMTVIEAKGLEFDVAFVFEDGMSENEKYIAYTRSLSELYLVSDKPTVLAEVEN